MVDTVIVLLVVLAATVGAYVGATVQLFTLAAFAAGGVVGTVVARLVGLALGGYLAQTMVTIATVAVAATFGAPLGYLLARRVTVDERWRETNRVAGSVVAGFLVVFGSWLVGSAFAGAPGLEPVTATIQRSLILRGVDQVLPPAPAVFARVAAELEPPGFPSVFAGFEPVPRSTAPPPSRQTVNAAVANARRATVAISGTACARSTGGSGFVAAPQLVVTNAHVVAGVDEPAVLAGDELLPAVPVVFDPQLDVAVLRVANLGAPPLVVADRTVESGTEAVALGFPAGFVPAPAVVLGRANAHGRDIYADARVDRDVYQLQADIDPGASGGPVVLEDGTVIGVVISRSLIARDIGYALTSPAVREAVQRARALTESADTGPCLR